MIVSRWAFAFAFAFAFSFAFAGCAHRAATGGDLSATWDQTWKTMRAQHRVSIDVEVAPGKIEHRQMRGLIAIERPSRFRLRGLGPAGITLFEVVRDGAEARVLQAIQDPKGELFKKLLDSLEHDLVDAYALEPQYESRTYGTRGPIARMTSDTREVTLTRFRRIGAHVVPTHLEIAVRSALVYQVHIDVSDIELDVPLDSALWAL